MQISITNTIFQTQFFTLIFILSLLLFWSKKTQFNFSSALTKELKGFAMLAIVLSHIGYFLVTDHNFLFPLSVGAGVGVNLFLLLSGFGLTISQVKKPLSIKEFYLKRLPKLFIPLWVVITILYISDAIFLHKYYLLPVILQSYLGFYPSSDIFGALDSPLWYLTLILYFYLIFPVFFFPKKIWVSAGVIFVLAYVLLSLLLPLDSGVQKLYQLHFIAFPLGILIAWLLPKISQIKLPAILLTLGSKIILAAVFLSAFCYLALNSGVGRSEALEQSLSIISTILIILVFWLLPIRFKLLNLVGKYSYEIYLLHWPIIYRYDHWFKILPASLAIGAYLIEFIALGWALQFITGKLTTGIKLLS